MNSFIVCEKLYGQMLFMSGIYSSICGAHLRLCRGVICDEGKSGILSVHGGNKDCSRPMNEARIAGMFLSDDWKTYLHWFIQLNSLLLCGLIFAKNAAQFVLMMEFVAANRVLQPQIHGGGGQHPQRRREKVNPQ